MVTGTDRIAFGCLSRDEARLDIARTPRGDRVFEHEPYLNDNCVSIVQAADIYRALDLVTYNRPRERVDGCVGPGIKVCTVAGVDKGGDHAQRLIVAKIATTGRLDVPASRKRDLAILGAGVARNSDFDLERHDLAQRHVLRREGLDLHGGAGDGVNEIGIRDRSIAIPSACRRCQRWEWDRGYVEVRVGRCEGNRVRTARSKGWLHHRCHWQNVEDQGQDHQQAPAHAGGGPKTTSTTTSFHVCLSFSRNLWTSHAQGGGQKRGDLVS